jgi:tetratricopeptide (TPR) repeat protein
MNRRVCSIILLSALCALAACSSGSSGPPEAAKALHESALTKSTAGDHRGAILDLSKAIGLYHRYDQAYHDRGVEKATIEEYKGAISDYTKAIELSQKSTYYCDRGGARFALEDYKGAVEDLNKAIELDSKNALAFWKRGFIRGGSGNQEAGCRDIKTAADLGNAEAAKFFKENCK